MRSTADRRRMLAVSGTVLALVISLAGCTGTETRVETPDPGPDPQVVIGAASELTSFNPAAAQQDTDINAQIYYATHETFGYLDDTLQIVQNDGFGTLEKISDDPLTVKYTLNKDLKWSDGQPITADDLLFGWAASSGYFDDATLGSDGQIVSGTRYFTPASTPSGFRDTAVPVVSDDKLTLTLTYDLPTPDWNVNWLVSQPLHVVAQKAGLTAQSLLAAIRTTPKGIPTKPETPDATLLAAADVWNKGFAATSLPSDPALYVSNGPFVVESWVPGTSMTLVANPNYHGSRTPKFSRLIYRFSLGTDELVEGLRDHDLDIISPLATGETRDSLQAIEGAEVLSGGLLAYTHFDVQYAGAYTDPDVREALLKVVPRKDLVDELVHPVDPEGAPLNSLVYPVAQSEQYKSAVSQNGSDAYADVDLAGAKTLLAGRTPTLRILYDTGDPQSAAVFAATRAAATEAGFEVVDVGTTQWRSELGGDGYDAVIAVSASQAVDNGLIPSVFASEGANNDTGVNIPQVNKLSLSLQTMTDPQAVEAASIKVDALLFKNHYGLPLFQHPGIIAHSDRVAGVSFMAGPAGPLWNFWRWSVSAASPAP
ncbi:ABC transporter substrate-binding protein [Microbacterium rhizomatis]|uniref:ABC transporter family substrate-binding protein n=1 Tax=Microbacterium rhizomatis TaxID=1631477 RepID=A0A5J5J2V6_9MICO|nr:ABC transporter substrate-binding protein [Microbacterium rhizomatis]KAA9110232.1 ABC transporter family substrate-binding protein [Microbacterium rhizomatis]